MPITIHSLNFPPREYGGYIIRVELLKVILPEIYPLWEAQWNEIETKRPPFNPDTERLVMTEAAGNYFQITARQDGELVGGLGMFVFSHLITQQMYGEESSLYLKPEHRKGFLASSVCRYAVDVLRYLKVSEVSVTVKSYANTGKMLERLGFRQTDTVYMMNLGD